MKRIQRLGWVAAAWALGWVLTAAPAVRAEPHRATHLGNPATRFAPPLQKPEDLRRLLQDESLRADVESVLRQAGWKGAAEDLRKAAATAEIVSVKLPKGTRLPFMSTRRNGRPIALIDVIWAGKEPIDAYAFEFNSLGRRYRCITPKPCSNFLVVDLGPEPRPSLQLSRTAPDSASRCEPIPMTVTVRNGGKAPALGVVVSESLPDGLKLPDGQTTVRLEAGDLEPGESRELKFSVLAAVPGTYTNRARATTSDLLGVEAASVTEVLGPVLTLNCTAPAESSVGRPVEVCLTVGNTGNAPEPKATVTLPVPAGAVVASATEGGAVVDGRVVWELTDLPPQGGRKLCVVLTAREPATLDLAGGVRGSCGAPAESRCASRVAGIAAILLEVVDLEDPVEVGQPVTYEIKVVNQGNGPLTRIKLVGAVPEGQEYVSGSGATAVTAEGRTVTTEALAELAPKAEAVWRMVLKATGQGDIRFKIDLTADQFPRAVEEYEATSQY